MARKKCAEVRVVERIKRLACFKIKKNLHNFLIEKKNKLEVKAYDKNNTWEGKKYCTLWEAHTTVNTKNID